MKRMVMAFAVVLSLAGTAAATPIVDFTSGPAVSGDSRASGYQLDANRVYTFGPGGTFTIGGTVPGVGVGRTVRIDFFGPQSENILEVSAFRRRLDHASGRGRPFAGPALAAEVAVVPTPEPASLALLGGGLVGLAALIRRQSRRPIT